MNYVVRLQENQDLKKEIIKLVNQNQITNGVISSSVGSLKKLNLRLASAKNFLTLEKDFEILSLNGTVSINGVHLHLTASDENGNSYGGHLIENNLINTTCELVISTIDEVHFDRLLDPTTGYKELVVNNGLPVLAEFYDQIYLNHGYNNVRHTVRLIIKNQENKFLYLNIVGQDVFGKRNHLETSGGGIEANENDLQAIKRELMEELGLKPKKIEKLGIIKDYYNILARKNIHHYYYVEVNDTEQHSLNRTLEEQELINDVLKLNAEQVLQMLNKKVNGVNMLVHQRELFAFKYCYNLLQDNFFCDTI